MSEIKKATEFTVERSKWLRGEGHQESALLRESDGKMCCMGFYALACGAKSEEIVNCGAFYNLTGQLRTFEDVGGRVYEINDNPCIPEKDREALIIHKLGAVGIKVTFVD